MKECSKQAVRESQSKLQLVYLESRLIQLSQKRSERERSGKRDIWYHKSVKCNLNRKLVLQVKNLINQSIDRKYLLGRRNSSRKLVLTNHRFHQMLTAVNQRVKNPKQT